MSSTKTKVAIPNCQLILVRHARTRLAGTFCGHTDPPVSEEGLAQLPELNRVLAGESFTHIFSSDLQRTRQTAQSVAIHNNLHVHEIASLREVAFGSWEGLDWDQVMARDPDYAQRWLDLHPSIPAPGGEAFDDFRHRIRGAMHSVALQLPPGGCAVVVTHAGVIRTFLGEVALFSGVAADFSRCDYTSCWKVACENGQWKLPESTVSASVCQVSGDGR